jgi:DNA-binding transcriptional MerR regulator
MTEIKDAGGLTWKEWQRKIKAGEELTPDEQEQVVRFGKAMSSNVSNALSGLFSGVETMRAFAKAQREMVERVSESLNLAKTMIESARRMQEQILESTRHFAESFSRIGERFGEWLKQSFESLRILFERSHIQLIVNASKGDPVSLSTLGRMWWRLWFLYRRYKMSAGEDISKGDFHQEIAIACLKFLKEESENHIPLFDIPRKIFYRLQYELAKRYIKVLEDQRGGFSINVFSDSDGELPDGYFTETASLLAGVSPRTVRNWIKSGKISAVRGSYNSVTRQKEVQVYIIPYSDELRETLNAIKENNKDIKFHHREGFLTVSEVREMYNNAISRKTLERWDEDGILVPRRIGGIRYYKAEQARSVGQILIKNNSPRIRKVLALRPAIV